MLKLLLIPISAALFRIGGAGKEEIKWASAWYRDMLIPILNFIYYFLTANLLTAILTGGATNAIRMGRGAWDPEHDDKPSWLGKVTRDREGWKIRMIYSGICSVAIGLFPTLNALFSGHYLAGIGYLVYIALNVGAAYLVNTTKVKGNVWIVESVEGAMFSLVYFLCR